MAYIALKATGIHSLQRMVGSQGLWWQQPQGNHPLLHMTKKEGRLLFIPIHQVDMGQILCTWGACIRLWLGWHDFMSLKKKSWELNAEESLALQLCWSLAPSVLNKCRWQYLWIHLSEGLLPFPFLIHPSLQDVEIRRPQVEGLALPGANSSAG